MIYDKIDYIETYKGLSEDIYLGLTFLKNATNLLSAEGSGSGSPEGSADGLEVFLGGFSVFFPPEGSSEGSDVDDAGSSVFEPSFPSAFLKTPQPASEAIIAITSSAASIFFIRVSFLLRGRA